MPPTPKAAIMKKNHSQVRLAGAASRPLGGFTARAAAKVLPGPTRRRPVNRAETMRRGGVRRADFVEGNSARLMMVLFF